MGRREGSITVFLSISGILIFALLGTLVETARLTACQNHAARTLRMAADGLMTEYSLPLYENYGLFFIENCGIPFETVIAEYVGDTMEAAKKGVGFMDFLAGETGGIQVTKKQFAGEEQAEGLRQEIKQYMKRRLTQKQFQNFLNQSDQILNTEQEAQKIEQAVQEEQEAAELDRYLLKLIALVDGITINGGNISCAENFVKVFAVRERTAANFGITNNSVWEKMQQCLYEVPSDWENADLSEVKQHVEQVLILTEEALTIAKELQRKCEERILGNTEYIDHLNQMKNLADRLVSVLPANKKVLQDVNEILDHDRGEEELSQLDALWEQYDTDSIVFSYAGIGDKTGEEPLKNLGSAWKDGILNLVCTNPKKLSAKKVKKADNYRKLYAVDNKSGVAKENFGERVEDLTEEQNVKLSGVMGDLAGYTIDEFYLGSYMQDKFTGYTKSGTKWKRALDYQWEYILAGKNTDKENLKAVLERIFLVRTVVNFSAIYKDSGKNKQAYAAAAAIAGFSGMEFLVRLTQTLILVTWAMVESLTDVAGILQERNVPLLKSSKKILTSFQDLFRIEQKVIVKRAERFPKKTKKSFGYDNYVMLFLAMSGQTDHLYRMMDLAEWDMNKNGYKEFQFGNCVYGLEVKGSFRFSTRFFRMPVIENMLGREIEQYQFVCEIVRRYV